MKGIIRFFITPGLSLEDHLTFRQKLLRFVNAIVFLLLIRAAVVLVVVIEKILDYDVLWSVLRAHKSPQIGRNPFMMLVLVIIIIPVIEEVAFRGFLTLRRKVVSVSLATLIVVIGNFVYLRVVATSCAIGLYHRFGISLLLVVLIFWILERYHEEITDYIRVHFRQVLYISFVLFAIIHVPNYRVESFSAAQWVMLPIALFQYIGIAIVTSYLRIEIGLVWAMSFHIFNNLVASIPLLFNFINEG